MAMSSPWLGRGSLPMSSWLKRSAKLIIGVALLTMMPMAPFSECEQMQITARSKRGSVMAGMAMSICPVR